MELSNQWIEKGRKDAVKELSNQWIDKGRREGRQEAVKELSNQWLDKGRQEGRKDAAFNLALGLLNRQFGPVSEATSEALAALPTTRLEALALEIPYLSSLEALADHL